MPPLPSARGAASALVLDALRREPHAIAPLRRPPADDPIGDDDLQLALYVCYELHYRGFDGVDEGWEWEPSLLGLRRELEAEFEQALEREVPRDAGASLPAPEEMDVALRAIADADEGPSLSRHLEVSGSLEQFLEFCVHRSAYQLKEADPHSWALPRIGGAPKAAMVEIQADEYGGGRAERIHAELFPPAARALGAHGAPRAPPRGGLSARARRAPGRAAASGPSLEVIPGVPLATVTLMSLCARPRRRRGAIAGPPPLFEMTSPVPNRRYANALRRLGLGEDAT